MMKRLSKRLSSALFGEDTGTVHPKGSAVEMHEKVFVSILPNETLKVCLSLSEFIVTSIIPFQKLTYCIGKQYSRKFALFQASSNSFMKLKRTEYVTSDTKGLALRKWCFDLEDEKELMEIEGALPLLYHQAKHDIGTGKLQPDDSTKSKLEELIIPKSETYHQYLSICQEIDDYFAVEFKGCDVSQEVKIKSLQLRPGTTFSVVLFDRGIRLRIDNADYLISWRKILSWTRVEDEKRIEFEVYSPSEDSYSTLSVETVEAHYMLAVLMELIKHLQDVLDGPMFETSDLVIDSNGKVAKWKNVLFSVRRFNAENELATKYEDLTS
ncbi:uncharacterized protein [Antedon mediterranea]|uniref:uncharacterized protein isoform X2 n=1 Tax=Antedon mediterranea TaxID=105859 RepID=UPI003AF9F7F2